MFDRGSTLRVSKGYLYEYKTGCNWKALREEKRVIFISSFQLVREWSDTFRYGISKMKRCQIFAQIWHVWMIESDRNTKMDAIIRFVIRRIKKKEKYMAA